MWSVKYLSIENIAAFKQAEYHFNNGVVTLVYGENMDNDSQLSNGSGKSAFSEAIAIALTGVPLRSVKQDEIINNDSDSAVVRLMLYNAATKDTMVIYRAIYKGNKPQNVNVSIAHENGEEVPCTLSGVDQYNKYILDTIGVTKDEIYSSFILCRLRYVDFILASDRDKKEIINKFSRGNMVDQAIDKLKDEKNVNESELQSIRLKLSNLEGKQSLLITQIEESKEAAERKKQNDIELRISTLERINNDKEKVGKILDQMQEKKKIMETISIQTEQLNDFEDNRYEGKNLDEIQKYLRDKNYLPAFPFDQYDARKVKDDIAEIEQIIQNEKDALSKARSESSDIKSYLSEVTEQIKEIDLLIEQNKEAKIKESEISKNNYTVLNEKLTNVQNLWHSKKTESDQLAVKCLSSIKCPKCDHKFVVGDESFDLGEARRRIRQLNDEADECKKEIEQIGSEINHIYDKYNELCQKGKQLQDQRYSIAKSLTSAREKVDNNVRMINKHVSAIDDYTKRKEYLHNTIDSMTEDMMSEYFSQLEKKYNIVMQEYRNLKNECDFYNTRIDEGNSYLANLKDVDMNDYIESMKDKLDQVNSDIDDMKKQSDSVAQLVDTYNLQEKRFMEFKTYLANGKISSLSMITNQFLQQIGSDLSVRFDGYSVLRSGKIRDKISIAVLRDGMEIGSIGKLSVGEMSRIQLAVILAMHKLINLNADNNKGLDLLLIDEVLDGVDESGLANIVKSINQIGITSIIISHGKLAENYRYTLTVRKKNGVSTIHE